MKKILLFIGLFLTSIYYVKAETLQMFLLKENNYKDLNVNEKVCINVFDNGSNVLDETNIYINYSNKYFEFTDYEQNNKVYLNNGWTIKNIEDAKTDYEYGDLKSYGLLKIELTGGTSIPVYNNEKNYYLITKVCFNTKEVTDKENGYIILNDEKSTFKFGTDNYGVVDDSILYYEIKNNATHSIDSSLSTLNAFEFKANLSRPELYNEKTELYEFFPDVYEYEMTYVDDISINPICSSINCDIKYYKDGQQIEDLNLLTYDNSVIDITSTVNDSTTKYTIKFKRTNKSSEGSNNDTTDVVIDDNTNDNNKISVKTYIIAGICLLAAIIVLIVVLTINKKNKWKKRFEV